MQVNKLVVRSRVQVAHCSGHGLQKEVSGAVPAGQLVLSKAQTLGSAAFENPDIH